MNLMVPASSVAMSCRVYATFCFSIQPLFAVSSERR